MKIGIYGCSYADEMSAKFPNDGKSWSSHLRDRNFDISNFAQSGSSVYWSYNNYLKNHVKFDKNIILVTFPDRITIKDPDNNFFLFVTVWHTINDKQRSFYKNKNLDQAIELYYKYLHNIEEFQEYKNLIIEKLNKNHNTLVLDVKDLFEISKIDLYFYDRKEFWDPMIYKDNRFNHMNNLNNKILADQISEWLNTGNFNLNMNAFQTPKIEDAKKYFLKN